MFFSAANKKLSTPHIQPHAASYPRKSPVVVVGYAPPAHVHILVGVSTATKFEISPHTVVLLRRRCIFM